VNLLAAASDGRALWYLTRGSGVVALLLLTASMVLGIVSAIRWHGKRWPRFAVTDLHRNLTLLSIAFVVLHVVTTVADGFAPIGLRDAVVPFLSPYRPLWLGLGAVSFDLLLALVVTSLLRARVGPAAWRAIHWLAYASWPIAILHSFGTGSDARFGWLEVVGFGCVALVSIAVLARVAADHGLPSLRIAGAIAAVGAPLALFAWYANGPARPGWAIRAGTPVRIVARASASGRVLTAATSPPTSFVSSLTGRMKQTSTRSRQETLTLDLQLQGRPGGATRVVLRGSPTAGGVSLNASGVSFVPETTGAVYTGNVLALAGGRIMAAVADAAGQRLRLVFALSIDEATGNVSGTVAGTTPNRDGE
jgi:methionine sulfoxide reductase heme-binding subunit